MKFVRGLAAIALSLGPALAQVADKLDEVPHLFLAEQGEVVAKWISDGIVETRRFPAGKPIVLPDYAHFFGASLTLKVPEPTPCTWAAPGKLLVLSDVEGEYDALLRFLTANGVVDAKGAWAFGTGHLVGLGDMVDRGTQVTEVLWLFHRLSLEAAAAGGHIHFILGNHEVMMMGGDVRYTAPKYARVASLFGTTCQGLLGADTVLGRWLRTRNCVERIGDLLFVHAGLAVIWAGRAADLTAFNETVRQVLGLPPMGIEDVAVRELVWGRSGPLWYRGYFEQYSADFGPPPSADDFTGILAAVGAERIVVGHTKVREITPMFDGRVLAIDIPWTQPAAVRALLVRREGIAVVDILGRAKPLVLPGR